MFNSSVLDVAIGLILVYLVVSLLVTSANELVANLLRSRAAFLERGLTSLLSDKALVNRIYNHPLIRALASPDGKGKKPSYIPSRTFTLALLDVLKPAAPAGGAGAPAGPRQLVDALDDNVYGGLKVSLNALLDEAGGDLNAFKTNIEVWFNNVMERVGGWYKRKTQWVTLLLGAGAAVALNVDTISIVRQLSNDPALRASVVARATRVASAPPPASTRPASGEAASADPSALAADIRGNLKDLQNGYRDFNGLGLPVGWSNSRQDFTRDGHFDPFRSLEHLLGWLLTAVAASLGAPFWFDLLNKFINIRAAGTAPEEQPRKPRRVPQPAQPGQGAGQRAPLAADAPHAAGSAAPA